MSTIRMRGKLIGVVSNKKAHKNRGLGVIVPEDTNNSGHVRYIGEDVDNTDLKVGMHVIFGNKREPVNVDGEEILVMDQENIFAEKLEENEEKTQKSG